MPNELEVTQNRLNLELGGALKNAASIITKDYLASLDTYKILPPSSEVNDIDISQCGKFFKLTKLVINSEESFLGKLTTIVNVASSINCSIATIINSDGYEIDYYFGLLSKNDRGPGELKVSRRAANAAAFKGALSGNLVGSELEEVPAEKIKLFRDEILAKEGKCYSSVSGIVALRDEDNKSIDAYVQGIENLTDALKGQKYAIVMLADPVDTSSIQEIKQGYEILHTQLSTFAKSSVTINESDTLSLSKAATDGISHGLSKGIACTQSRTYTKGSSTGFNASVNASAGISFVVSANAGFSAGVNHSFNRSTSDQTGKTDSTTTTDQRSRAFTSTSSSAKTAGKSLQLNYENRSVKSLLDKIDKHLERLDECESFGAFDCAAYVIADTRDIALMVASNYNALMRGRDSSVQASHINSWFKPSDTRDLGKYIGALVHPMFKMGTGEQITVTPASIISGDELSIQVGLPKKSISGVTVIPMAPFGRNTIESKNDTIELGNLYHMGHDEGGLGKEHKVRIDINSLAMHTFITGSTGKGKSTAIFGILDKLKAHKVKGKWSNITFMVIEPAKGEYKDRFGNYKDVSVYGTNYKKMPLLKINPFSFPNDIHVLEHIDRLIEIFNVCWPMYAAMPAVLKDAVERAYVASGWDLNTSECKYKDSAGKPLYPSFGDVLLQVNNVMDASSYSSDSKGDYKGALCTRLKSLTNGLYSQIFTSDELPSEKLFDENVVIDLSRTGSSETKALIMGLLVMKLQEYRMSGATFGNAPLKHVTVLEEAHNILKRTSTEQPAEGANMLGKSVEMLANSIAEMRAYGEGFIIADQAPGLLDLSVIRNTNTKIIFGLPDLDDRELVGRAASLNDDQILELSRLKTFVAAVYQNNWLEPVLCNIEHNFKEIAPYKYSGGANMRIDKMKILEYMLLPIDKRNKLDARYVAGLADDVFKLPIPSEAKAAFMRYAKAQDKEDIKKLSRQVVYHLFNSDIAFGLASSKEGNAEQWYDYLKNVLEPDITGLDASCQKKIIMWLARERKEFNPGNAHSKDLYERLMSII